MVAGGVASDQDGDVGISDFVEGRRDRARSDVLDQRGHGRRVAKARAVIHIVVSERLANQFLEQIRFLVRAFRRTEAGDRAAAAIMLDPVEPGRRNPDRLLPRRLSKVRRGVGGIDVQILFQTFPSDERLGQAVRMADIVEPEPALDAQPLLVCRAVAAVDELDAPFLDLVSDLAADAAVGADGIHLLVDRSAILGVAQRRGREGPCRAGLDAFAASDACAFAHRIVKVEYDLGVVAPVSEPDDVVDLNVAAGSDAEVAMYASIQIDVHRDMRIVQKRNSRAFQFRKAELLHACQFSHVPAMRRLVVRGAGLRLVGRQHLDDRLPGFRGSFGTGRDRHAFRRHADA